MFDEVDDPGLLAGMAAALRDERVAIARRILLAGRLVKRRLTDVDADERTQWCIDNWEAVAAEIGAELGISRQRASTQMNYGVALLDDLPKLGAVFAAGKVEFRVVIAAVFRTGLITDPDLLNRIDTVLARCAAGWNRLSQKRLVQLIDLWVSCIDPAALRTAGTAADDRHIQFGEVHNGMIEFWGALRTPEAAALRRTLDQLAGTVCPSDPRTKEQRRADALTALAAGGSQSMPCACEQPDCPAATTTPPPPVVIHVIAEAATLNGQSETPGHLPGYGTVPPAVLRELAQHAKLRPLDPAALQCPEARYRPSAALAEFIRCRDRLHRRHHPRRPPNPHRPRPHPDDAHPPTHPRRRTRRPHPLGTRTQRKPLGRRPSAF
jgi:hypothetical protein